MSLLLTVASVTPLPPVLLPLSAVPYCSAPTSLQSHLLLTAAPLYLTPPQFNQAVPMQPGCTYCPNCPCCSLLCCCPYVQLLPSAVPKRPLMFSFPYATMLYPTVHYWPELPLMLTASLAAPIAPNAFVIWFNGTLPWPCFTNFARGIHAGHCETKNDC